MKLVVAFLYLWERAQKSTQISAIRKLQATNLVVGEGEKNLQQFFDE
jgi:hypothetical protein